MRNEQERLRLATRLMIENYYGAWLTHVVTLTMFECKKGSTITSEGWAKGAVNAFEIAITEKGALATIRYFVEALNYKLYKRKTRKARYKNCCRIIAIPVLEGVNGDKRMHIHILLGNLPSITAAELETAIKDVWAKTKWGMGRIQIDELHDIDGAAFYVTKEVGFSNNDAVCWKQASIPGRLRGVWA